MKYTTLKLALSIMFYGIINGAEDSDFSFAYFEFYEGNDGTKDLLCRVPLTAGEIHEVNKDAMTDKDGGINCKNDEARSMKLCNGDSNTVITVFDDGELSEESSYTEISVTKNFVGCETIPSFELVNGTNYKGVYLGDDNQVYVRYYEQYQNWKGWMNLDGYVSSFKVEPDWESNAFRFMLQVNEELERGFWKNDRGHNSYNEQQLVSSNKKYVLRMQYDGNLVLYKTNGSFFIEDTYIRKNGIKEALWASNTNGVGERPYRLVMQDDNHLVVYDGTNTTIWASGVYIKDPNQWQKSGFAVLQDDGNFVVRDGNWDVMWDSQTYGGKQGNYVEGNKHHASCDSKCKKCNSEPCHDWCSYDKWCGTSEDYQWTDCRACHYDE